MRLVNWHRFGKADQQLLRDLIRPFRSCAILSHADIITVWWSKQLICILKSSGRYSINPDYERRSKSLPCFNRRADEVRNRRVSGINNAITEPSHAPGVLNAILQRKAKMAIEVCAHLIGIEKNGLEFRSQNTGERCFAGSWKPHNEDLTRRGFILYRQPHLF